MTLTLEVVTNAQCGAVLGKGSKARSTLCNSRGNLVRGFQHAAPYVMCIFGSSHVHSPQFRSALL